MDRIQRREIERIATVPYLASSKRNDVVVELAWLAEALLGMDSRLDKKETSEPTSSHKHHWEFRDLDGDFTSAGRHAYCACGIARFFSIRWPAGEATAERK